jgi:hypothetical protein
VKTQYLVGVVLVDEAGRLSNVHLLLQVSVQEYRLHIHVMNRLVPVRGDGEHEAHGLETRHRHEHLFEIHPLTLDVSFGHQARFVTDDGTQLVTFHFVDPLEAYSAVTGKKLGETPSPVGDDGVHLLLHGVLPFRCMLGLLERPRLLSGDCVEFIKVKFTRCIPSIDVLPAAHQGIYLWW